MEEFCSGCDYSLNDLLQIINNDQTKALKFAQEHRMVLYKKFCDNCDGLCNVDMNKSSFRCGKHKVVAGQIKRCNFMYGIYKHTFFGSSNFKANSILAFVHNFVNELCIYEHINSTLNFKRSSFNTWKNKCHKVCEYYCLKNNIELTGSYLEEARDKFFNAVEEKSLRFHIFLVHTSELFNPYRYQRIDPVVDPQDNVMKPYEKPHPNQPPVVTNLTTGYCNNPLYGYGDIGNHYLSNHSYNTTMNSYAGSGNPYDNSANNYNGSNNAYNNVGNNYVSEDNRPTYSSVSNNYSNAGNIYVGGNTYTIDEIAKMTSSSLTESTVPANPEVTVSEVLPPSSTESDQQVEKVQPATENKDNDKFCSGCSHSFKDFIGMINKEPLELIKFAQRHKLMLCDYDKFCHKCHSRCKFGTKRLKFNCPKTDSGKTCGNFRFSIFRNTIFRRSHTANSNLLYFMLAFVSDWFTADVMMSMFNLSFNRVSIWTRFCNKVCEHYCCMNGIRLTGRGKNEPRKEFISAVKNNQLRFHQFLMATAELYSPYKYQPTYSTTATDEDFVIEKKSTKREPKAKTKVKGSAKAKTKVKPKGIKRPRKKKAKGTVGRKRKRIIEDDDEDEVMPTSQRRRGLNTKLKPDPSEIYPECIIEEKPGKDLLIKESNIFLS